jgi:hypothetical protein
MIHKTLFACVIIIFSAICAVGQTSADLERKYGQPLIVFAVRPDVSMAVKYGRDGQACEMTLERKHLVGSTVSQDTTLPDKLIDELVDELAPPAIRGGNRTDKALNGKFLLETTISGSSIFTERHYVHVTVEITGFIAQGSGNVVLIIKHNRGQCKPE